MAEYESIEHELVVKPNNFPIFILGSIVVLSFGLWSAKQSTTQNMHAVAATQRGATAIVPNGNIQLLRTQPLLKSGTPEEAMPSLPQNFAHQPQQAPVTLNSAIAFVAGCVAAVGMALSMRRPSQYSRNFFAVRPEILSDSCMCHMATIAGHHEVKEAPTILGLDKDENSLPRRWERVLRKGQDSICKAIEECDGKGKFVTDAWLRESGGGGISRVMADGKVWEKAGIGLSVIYGMMPTETLILARERQATYAKDLKPGEKVPFFTCGLSCVMHPRNPHCPTMHFNYRYFATEAGDWWFGGGTDITPAYLDEEDMKHFHGVYKKICDKHDPSFYAKFKKWADEYFLIKHRGETRGLGGIFYDDLNDRDPEKIFAFAEECLNNVVTAYVPIIEKHKNDPFTEEQKRWQLLRRGRYVEFNLIYDRGFIFGLKSGIGRVETMMMTLPETGRWEYNYEPPAGSEEAKILQLFRNPREWV